MGSSLFFNNYKTSAVQRVNNGILIDTILSALRFYNLWASTLCFASMKLERYFCDDFFDEYLDHQTIGR